MDLLLLCEVGVLNNLNLFIMDEAICEKIAYDDHKEAINHITALSKKTHKKYGTYKCVKCGKFHVKTNKVHRDRRLERKYVFDIDEVRFEKPMPKPTNPKGRRIVNTFELSSGKIITSEMAATLKNKLGLS